MSSPFSLDYQLLDSGNGYRYERFGLNRIVRPEPQAIWKPFQNPEKWEADLVATSVFGEGIQWEKKKSFQEPWRISFGPLNLELRFSNSRNIGIFPEQAFHWNWMHEIVKKTTTLSFEPSILNLFAYTGGATLVLADAGAKVRHVDSSQAAVNWANFNREINEMRHKPISWIVEDALSFLKREIRRGVKYDGMILDPPAFGKGGDKKIFRLQENIIELLTNCSKVLSEKPVLFLINLYALGYSKEWLLGLMKEVFPDHKIQTGELGLKSSHSPVLLPCGIYARFSCSR